MNSLKYSAFNITTTSYKIVNGQPIPVHILIPKALETGKAPLLVHFHGGFLFTGDALFPKWAAQWALDYALQHSAIRISANYRLLPESNGLEILSDVRDLFSWIENDLPDFLKSIGKELTPDIERIAVYGDSAGGYLAVQSALITRPGLIKAVIAAYPMTYVDDPWYSAPDIRPTLGTPQIPKLVLDEHIAAIDVGKIVTGAFPPERMDLSLAALQSGSITKLIGTDESLFPARVIEKMSGQENMPFLFVFGGKEDSTVPCEHTEKFARLWEGKFGEGSVVAKFVSGDHGFDVDTNLETAWLKEGLVSVSKVWIG